MSLASQAGRVELPSPAATANHPTKGKADRSLLSVWALAFAPSGQRQRWLWVVPACPCGGSHYHLGDARGGVRRPSCGATYRLVMRNDLQVVA
jgi:hypothetical protein